MAVTVHTTGRPTERSLARLNGARFYVAKPIAERNFATGGVDPKKSHQTLPIIDLHPASIQPIGAFVGARTRALTDGRSEHIASGGAGARIGATGSVARTVAAPSHAKENRSAQ